MVEAGEVIVRIKDEGIGIKRRPRAEHADVQLGVGIPGMRERLRLLGGRLEISSDSTGTTVAAIMPIEGETHATYPDR
jgi:signal transduction histidine kinase